jgi:predicted DNA-binding transcriptional regulator AlpA
MKILNYSDLKPQKGIAYSKVQIWRLEKQNKFPHRVRLGPARHGWIEEELDAWMADLARARNISAGRRP